MAKTYAEAEAELLAPRIALGACQILEDTGWKTRTEGRCYVTGKRSITVKAQDPRSAKLVGEWFTKGPFRVEGQGCGYTVTEVEKVTESRRDDAYPHHTYQYDFTIYRIDMRFACDSSD